jgi:hypothetical protein
MMRRYAVAGLLVAILALAATLPRWDATSIAQSDATPGPATAVPSPTPVFSATFVAEAEIDGLPAGSAVLSVSSFTLPAGTTTKPFANRGPVLIRVQSGLVGLDAEIAVVSPVVPPIGILEPEDPTPGPADRQPVPAGQQILVPAGGRAQITNIGTQPATLLVVTLTYAEPVASPEAGAASAVSQ